MANDEIQFCPYCGTKIDKDASFCKNCGKAIRFPSKSSGEEENQYNENQNKRKTVYEGVLHKCPNCGEIIDSFVTVCPSCGYEIRGAQSTGTVRELAKKLEEIEQVQMPENQSIMKKLFGKDFKGADEERIAKYQFEQQKEHQKANLIINFPVPNTKEDMLEFIILASSSIKTDDEDFYIDDVTEAWISKMKQVYQRAELSMEDTKEFARIHRIYNKKMEQIENLESQKKEKDKNEKIKHTVYIIVAIVAFLLLYGKYMFPTLFN